jgi:hypothetical protein
MRRACRLSQLAALALVTCAAPALAQDPPDAGPSDAGAEMRTYTSCVEHVPEGASRPKLTEHFPERGQSGWASSLEITVVHGKGETVLPGGFRVPHGTDGEHALADAGFVVPDPDGGAGPTMITEPGASTSTTRVTIPFVTLPKQGGRNLLTLPPIPITVARASGDLVTVCTSPHPIVVEDPIANEVDPKVRPNPPGRPQREEWVLAKQVVTIGALVLVLSAIATWLLLRWARRPRVEKAVPRRPPWEEALEELADIRASGLLAEGRTDVYFDRVSDCVRKYLGARYGFDGLESTTDEMQRLLARVRPPVRGLDTIGRFLEECDLVKFARVVPTENDCLAVLDRGETIVKNTMPATSQPEVALAAGRAP